MSDTLPQRKNLRYSGYDYRKAGAYFVTICIEDGLALLGRAVGETITCSEAGTMVMEVWQSIPDAFSNVTLDQFVVMPNHLHFVIWLRGEPLAGRASTPSRQDDVVEKPPALPDVMQWFKSLTTAKYREGVYQRNWPAYPGRLWQRSYYEHVVRSDAALFAIRQYIQANPKRWHLDRYHPNPVGQDEEAMALWQLLRSEGTPI